MKNIKVYSIRPIKLKKISIKALVFTWILMLLSFFWLSNNFNLLTNILQNTKISKSQLLTKAEKIKFDGTTWPVKEIVDYNYKNIALAWLTYEDLRKKNFDDVDYNLKTTFPTSWIDYMRKYKNITLKTCWDVFTDPEQLANFTFRRRILRATWTASYDSKNIWIKNTWTHAGIDIVSNVWTPIYSIANWLIIQIKKSNKWFWNLVSVLYKKDNKYYVWFYGHLHSINSSLKVWNFIKKWDRIWTIWKSWNSFWAHLHFQINKVDKLENILNWKDTEWLFKNLEELKKHTIDPIPFIENNYSSKKWDDLWILDKDTKKTNIVPDTKLVVNTIKNTENKKFYAKETTEKASIKNININLIDNKIQKWYSFTMKINVNPWMWKIAIVPSNTNLSFHPDIIENPSKKTYIINFFAVKEWNTTLKVYDWQSERKYDIKVYKASSEKIFWINAKLQKNLNLLSEEEVIIYPTNKFWQKINIPLKWKFDIYILKNWIKKLVKSVILDSVNNKVFIKWNIIWNAKLIIENKKYYLKKNIIIDVAKDYPYNWKYADSMYNLIVKWIIKWDKWYLYPNRNITRREFMIILWRSVLKTDYKKAKIEMQNYIKTKGKFFKDINWKYYADPYIYDAWKKWIIRWYKWYSLANTYVKKWELLLILTRLFKIKLIKNSLNVWTDLKSGEFKYVADTAKQYDLYPFENLKTFWAWEKVTRLIAFETLERFLEFKNDDFHASANIDTTNPEVWLNKVMKDIFDF